MLTARVAFDFALNACELILSAILCHLCVSRPLLPHVLHRPNSVHDLFVTRTSSFSAEF